ncbi:alpha/beta fold hydrolase [Roseovarius pelagicus]|uniref:Alpha/beta hydrolase n=1 Tax=Roseovarius pelagicus TaxID=2980108 RepID=A0ABY6DC38_9RHOB|nr:alpha/beta hydrolase [Roseovarius pelagicus]UXX83692.1 alpha/beta hydrolase [Roseovarius pelagicus]
MTTKLILMALAAVALAAGCGGLAGKRERDARTEFPPIGQFVEVGDTTVHAWVRGSGPDLVLIHGAGGNLRDFTFRLADQLTNRYRVIAFDRPGHGWTDRLPGFGGAGSTRGESPAEQAALLQKAAKQLGVQRPIVLGHSFGGAVALAWGLSQPRDTAALVIVGGVSQPWPGEIDRYYKVTSSAIGGATVVPLITALAPDSRIEDALAGIFAPQSPPDGYAEYVGPGLTLRRASLRANGQQVSSLKAHVTEMSKRYADTLTMPVEIVHGTADTTVPLQIHAEPLARQLRRGTLTQLEGVGHMPQHAAPTAVIAAVDRAARRARLR